MSAMHEVTMKIVNMIAKKMSIGRFVSGRFGMRAGVRTSTARFVASGGGDRHRASITADYTRA